MQLIILQGCKAFATSRRCVYSSFGLLSAALGWSNRCKLRPFKTSTVCYAQSVLLRDVCLISSRFIVCQLELQYERNMLLSLGRTLAGLRFKTNMEFSSAGDLNGRWKHWLISESCNHLTYYIFSKVTLPDAQLKTYMHFYRIGQRRAYILPFLAHSSDY